MPERHPFPLVRRKWAFEWLCGTLSPYASPTVQPEQLDVEDWQILIAAADSHLVLPKLHVALDRSMAEPPEFVRECLQVVSEYNQDRNRLILEQFLEAGKALNTAGIVPVPLKGVESLLLDSRSASGRILHDIDIWLPRESQLESAMEVFRSLGYDSAVDHGKLNQIKEKVHHVPPFYHPDRPVRVELHHRLVRPYLAPLVPDVRAKKRLLRMTTSGVVLDRLDERDGLAISYVQSTHMASPDFYTARVPLYKWLDFLERSFQMNGSPCTNRSQLGVEGSNEEMDIHFLSALRILCNFPYTGIVDDHYLQRRDVLLSRSKWMTLFDDALQRIKKGNLVRWDLPMACCRFLSRLYQNYKKPPMSGRY
jgi:hypothetical protein